MRRPRRLWAGGVRNDEPSVAGGRPSGAPTSILIEVPEIEGQTEQRQATRDLAVTQESRHGGQGSECEAECPGRRRPRIGLHSSARVVVKSTHGGPSLPDQRSSSQSLLVAWTVSLTLLHVRKASESPRVTRRALSPIGHSQSIAPGGLLHGRGHTF